MALVSYREITTLFLSDANIHRVLWWPGSHLAIYNAWLLSAVSYVSLLDNLPVLVLSFTPTVSYSLILMNALEAFGLLLCLIISFIYGKN